MHSNGSTAPREIAQQLMSGENVLWWGRPSQGIMLTARDALLIPFSLFWGGFAIFWESSVLTSRAPFPFALFGIPFILIGLFLIFGRFLLDRWLRGRMFYALTDRRVLISRSPPWASLKSINLDRLPEATLNAGSDGRGTISFGAAAPFLASLAGNRGFSGWVPSLDPIPQFLGVNDVTAVFALVQERSHARTG